MAAWRAADGPKAEPAADAGCYGGLRPRISPAASRGPVRGPSHRCKQCNQGHLWHDSVVSVQLVRTMHGTVVLIIRRSWVRAPPPPHTFTCGNLCGWPPKEGWRAARRPRATVSPMSVMPVPERPGALCRQHPDPGLWISDLRFEQEEARRVCRIRPELADCRAWTLAQPAFRMDAGLVAAMTPAERFAERRKRRQKPWPATLEPVGPGPGRAAPQPDQVSRPEAATVRSLRSRWTRPPSSSRNSSAGASVNSSPPWVAPRPTLGSRNAPASAIPPLCVSTSRAGPRSAQGII